MARSKKQTSKPSRLASLPTNLSKPKLNLATDTKRGIAVVVFVVLAGVSALSLAGIAGYFGALIARGLSLLFGIIAYLAPIFLLLIAYSLFRPRTEEDKQYLYFRTYFGSILMFGSIAGLIHLTYLYSGGEAFATASAGHGGGYLGALFAGPLFGLLGVWAGGLVLLALLLIGLLVTFNISLKALWPKRKVDAAVAADNQSKIEKVKINGVASVSSFLFLSGTGSLTNPESAIPLILTFSIFD